jgi:UDP-N-acetylglucosamine--N-acetylmuramyl-(pentapeptide) pyrophosphoryl-undecaprenol N-acetylglucosamine transferase
MNILLTGGGSAGHINPMITVGLELQKHGHKILCCGGKKGLEEKLIPIVGLKLTTIKKVPMPRSFNIKLFKFFPDFLKAKRQASNIIKSFAPDVVVGFGGYISFPFYVLLRKNKNIKVLIHDANVNPGFANKFAYKYLKNAKFATAFSNTKFLTDVNRVKNVGLPTKIKFLKKHTINDDRKKLLVMGGSLGAKHLNDVVLSSWQDLIKISDIFHITGKDKIFESPNKNHYKVIEYVDDLTEFYSKCDFAITRGGAGTINELELTGMPSAIIPSPIGNGEQKLNAQELVSIGAAITTDNSKFSKDWIVKKVIPILKNNSELKKMSKKAFSLAKINATEKLVGMIESVHEIKRH